MCMSGCTISGDVELDQLHEVCHLRREPLDLIITQAQLTQVQQAEEWLQNTNTHTLRKRRQENITSTGTSTSTQTCVSGVALPRESTALNKRRERRESHRPLITNMSVWQH